VKVITADATKFPFPKKADVIICEMLDTALIDEEQVPVLNSVRKYLKNNGIIIPYGILNCIEPVEVDIEDICYEEDGHPRNKVLGDPLFYNKINFLDHIPETFNEHLKINIKNLGYVSGLKITTFTLLTDNIICGPTPMLNPPLIIPINRIKVHSGDVLQLKLHYIMGGGLESVSARIENIHRKTPKDHVFMHRK
jgi:predicted RNA methylase